MKRGMKSIINLLVFQV